MTIAQRFIEMGEKMGIDTSNCTTGNIAEVVNTMIQEQGGDVADSQNIQLAMMNFVNTIGEESSNEPANNEEPNNENIIPD